MDSSLALLILFFIKKFDHFLPELLHKRARLLNKECPLQYYDQQYSQTSLWECFAIYIFYKIGKICYIYKDFIQKGLINMKQVTKVIEK